MALRPRNDFITDRGRRTTFYGVVLRIVPGDASLLVEIEHAPDSAGAPNVASAVSLGTVGPFARQGGIFVHRAANDDATHWFRVRHVGLSVNPGTFTGWLSGTTQFLDAATLEAIASGRQATAHPIIRRIPLADGDYNVPSTTDDGLLIKSTVEESGGKPVNRLFAKPLAADPDTMDFVPDGTTFARTKGTALTGGEVDLSKAGVISKFAGNLVRSSGNATPLSQLVNFIQDTGHPAADMQESGGKAINRLFAKTLAADADTLDSAADGTTFKKVLAVSSGLITPGSVTGRSRCKLIGGGNQTITTGTETIVLWPTETYDIGGLHDTVTNTGRITVPVGGDTRPWFFTAQIQWDNTTGGVSMIRIVKNGATEIAKAIDANFADATLAQGLTQNMVGVDSDPAVGDFYDVRVTHTKGSNRTVNRSASSFSATHHW